MGIFKCLKPAAVDEFVTEQHNSRLAPVAPLRQSREQYNIGAAKAEIAHLSRELEIEKARSAGGASLASPVSGAHSVFSLRNGVEAEPLGQAVARLAETAAQEAKMKTMSDHLIAARAEASAARDAQAATAASQAADAAAAKKAALAAREHQAALAAQAEVAALSDRARLGAAHKAQEEEAAAALRHQAELLAKAQEAAAQQATLLAAAEAEKRAAVAEAERQAALVRQMQEQAAASAQQSSAASAAAAEALAAEAQQKLALLAEQGEELKRQLAERQELAQALQAKNLQLEELNSGHLLMNEATSDQAGQLLQDYQALKHEHGKLLGDMQTKDQMMDLLQRQLADMAGDLDVEKILREAVRTPARGGGTRPPRTPVGRGMTAPLNGTKV